MGRHQLEPGHPPQSPTVRYGLGQAYDLARSRTVVFSGLGTPSYESDTWAFDGTTWQQVATSGPIGRIYPAMVYDIARSVVVMWGGYANPNSLNDTWEWNGTNWSQVQTATSPPARWGHAMSYDFASRRVIMHGGRDTAELSDTWAYDGVDWIPLNPGPPVPSARRLHSMVFDNRNLRNLMFGGSFGGGETWTFDYGTPATYVAYGRGCPGSAGTPALGTAAGSLPWINGPFTVEISSVPVASPVLLFFGASDTNWGAVSLPLPLDSIGMPGCSLLAGASLILGMTNTAGTASLTVPIPNDPSLVRGSFYNQGLVVDPPANAAGLTLSNGAAATIGRR